MNENFNQNSNKMPDITELAKSPYGNLELTKYLYESGLQNIFNTYQQNISNLEQNKQRELQDAYMVREMSQKYLGEYASNVGIGDVSGNLLDIYGQYQSNLSEIERNYGQLELGLEQEFMQRRQQSLNDILMADFNLEVGRLNEIERGVMYNIEMGQTGKLTDQEYLDKEFQAGNISDETYRQASLGIMGQQRTQEERELWGRITRGEMSMEDLTTAYEDGQISVEAYNQYYNAMQEQDRLDAANTVRFNVVRGNTEGLSTEQYLNNALENGLIDEATYQQLVLDYVETEETGRIRDISYNIFMNQIPDGQTVEQYLQGELNAGNITQAQFQSLMVESRDRVVQGEQSEIMVNASKNIVPEGFANMDEYLQDAFDRGVIDGQQLTTLTLAQYDRAQQSALADTFDNAISEWDFEAYIQRRVESGALSPDNARLALSSLQQMAQEEAMEAIDTGNYGFDEQGNVILTLDNYLESVRGKIGEQYYQRLNDMLEYQSQTTPKGEIIPNPTFTVGQDEQGEDISVSVSDLSYLPVDPSITAQSGLFRIRSEVTGTTDYAISGYEVNEDPYFESEGAFAPTQAELIDFADVDKLENNQFYQFSDGEFYLFRDNQLFRLVPYDYQAETARFTPEYMSQWSDETRDGGDPATGMDFEFRARAAGRETFTYKGVSYEREGRKINDPRILDEMDNIHGEHVNGKAGVVFFQGKFYVRTNRGDVYEMDRQD